jgi:hypothetical protein
MDEPFLTVKLDGWYALECVDVDNLEGVDIEKKDGQAGAPLSCSGLFCYGFYLASCSL